MCPLLRDPPCDIADLPPRWAEVDKLKQAGIIASGMIPKVDSATTAIDAGVDKVSFVDGRVHHAVLLEIFTDEGVGTEEMSDKPHPKQHQSPYHSDLRAFSANHHSWERISCVYERWAASS